MVYYETQCFEREGLTKGAENSRRNKQAKEWRVNEHQLNKGVWEEWRHEECLPDTFEITSPHLSKIYVWIWWVVKGEQNSNILTSSSFHHLEH